MNIEETKKQFLKNTKFIIDGMLSKNYDLEEKIQQLQSQLDIANKKLDKIKEFVNKSIRPEYRNGNSNEFYLEMNEKELKKFLSIIDMNNKEKLVSSKGE